MNKAYSRINWQNKPSTQTPIDADNLNRMDLALDIIDDRVIALDTGESGLNTRLTTAEGNITSLQNGKVDKITGKGLSTNDYTTAEKTKLAGISTQANKTTVTQVQTEGKEVAKIGIDGVDTSIYVEDIIDDDTISEDSTFSSSKIDEFTEEKTLEILDDLTDATTKIGNPILLTTKFGNVVKACSVDLFPKQDLHGYDYPWVGGAGINKLANLKDGTYSGNGVTAIVKDGVATLSGTTTASGNAIIIPLDKAVTVPNQTCYIHSMNSAQNGSVQPSIEKNGDAPNTAIAFAFTPVNRITEIPQARYGVTVDQVRFYLASGVTLSGTFSPMICLTNTPSAFEPYSNICPISGWTELNLNRCGKNIVNEIHHGNINSNGTYGTGNTRATNATSETSSVIKVKAGKYTISAVGLDYATILTKDNYNNIVDNFAGSWHELPYTFTITQTANLYFTARKSDNTSITLSDVSVQIEEGETATDYEPYNGQTYTESLGATYYGGKVDFVSGEVVIDKGYKLFDGTESWTISGSGSAVNIVADMKTTSASEKAGICSKLKTDYGVNGCAQFGSNQGSNQFFIINARDFYGLDTVEKIQAFTDGMQIAYPLATPIEIDLTPEQISLLKGNNVLSTDGDNINLSYQELPDINALFDYVQTLEARIKALEDE